MPIPFAVTESIGAQLGTWWSGQLPVVECGWDGDQGGDFVM